MARRDLDLGIESADTTVDLGELGQDAHFVAEDRKRETGKRIDAIFLPSRRLITKQW